MKDRIQLIIFSVGAAAAAWAFWAVSGQWGFTILIFMGIVDLALQYTRLLTQNPTNDKKSVRWRLVSAWGSVIAMALLIVDLQMTTSRLQHQIDASNGASIQNYRSH